MSSHCFQAFRRLLLLPISPLSITSVSESQVSIFFSHLHASGFASFFVWFKEAFNFPKDFCFLFIEFHGSLLTWVATSEDLGGVIQLVLKLNWLVLRFGFVCVSCF